ncbi:unnamed protein product, partial [Mesorhabditis spiculigera]
MKIDGRRVAVDYERGRTQKSWLPRRLGGGKGDTRKTRESKAELLSRSGTTVAEADADPALAIVAVTGEATVAETAVVIEEVTEVEIVAVIDTVATDMAAAATEPRAPWMEASTSSEQSDVVWSLCEKLRSEKLLLSSEKETVVQLHKQITDRLVELGTTEWSSQQHQLTLHRLINSHESVKPEATCKLVSQISDLPWVEAYRRLEHHAANYESLLNLLFKHPKATADFLLACDALTPDDKVSSEQVTFAVYSLVYSNSLFPDDERLVMDVLKNLIDLQVVHHNDPRLLLRRGNSAFPRLYRLFAEKLFPAKIFLTSALHDAVMNVLCQEDIYLDIDPAKSPLRFPTAERARRFGPDPQSPHYHKKVAQHRKIIIEKLVLLTHSFVKGITDSLACFPASLTWLVQQMYQSLVANGTSEQQALLICTDLVVTNLLCPAITNPESLGVISDTPIGHIARFNLMQMGQLVQVLALSKYEQPQAHLQLFTAQFKDSQICDIVTHLLNRQLPRLEAMFPPIVCESNRNEELFKKTHFLGSLFEVNCLLNGVRSTAAENMKDAGKLKSMKDYIKRMPAAFSTPLTNNNTPHSQGDPSERRNKIRQFTDKVQTAFRNDGEAPPSLEINTPAVELPLEYFDIVVFRFNEDEKLGLQPEEKFMEKISKEAKRQKIAGGDKEKRTRFLDNASTIGSAVSESTEAPASDIEDGDGDGDSLSSSMEPPHEDRLLMLDEDGASTLPDNVSDVGPMSGRGSPSLSGRGTPLSQIGQPDQQEPEVDGQENEAELAAASTTAGDRDDPARRALPPLPVTVRKENAEGLEEKFGKFSLPPNSSGRGGYRDDQRSLLSDSWSTDVVASDNEGPAPLPPLPPGDNLAPGGHRAGRHAGRSGSLGGQPGGPGGEDRSDTWSLDAVASDSEADGRERDREVDREVQHNQQLQGNNVLNNIAAPNEVPVENLLNLNLDPPAEPMNAQGQGDRMRRQSSGSSFLSRSDLDSDAGLLRDVDDVQAMPPDQASTSKTPPALPPRPPNAGTPTPPRIPPRPLTQERPSSSGATIGSPTTSEPADQKPGPSGNSPFSGAALRGKKTAIFQGLRNVGDKIGDKMRKGMNATPLRQFPHSSTFNDLLGSLPGSSDWRNDAQRRRGSEPKLSCSSSQPVNLHKLPDIAPEEILSKYKSQQKPSVVLVDISDLPAEPVAAQNAGLYYDSTNLTQCRAFGDAKRKLRHVLSNVGTLPAPVLLSRRDNVGPVDALSERHQLMRLLRVLLAEAINSREQVLTAHIREVIRVLAFFDDKGVRKLLRALRDDHRKRTSYVLYLQQSRLTLLRLLSQIDCLDHRVKKGRELIRECIVEVLVRFYLDNHDSSMKRLLHDFQQRSLQDERIELLTRTLNTMLDRMRDNLMWRDAFPEMLEFANKTVERLFYARIYNVAFYPNYEADHSRDEVLCKALQRLSRTVTPDHPMLHIPRELHGEAPWPSAQADIEIINAYKSPRDKLQCVVRACSTISNLIALAPGAGPAAADDLTPVLVYVLIQANPQSLMSNVQYVQSFSGHDMNGSDLYWWTQFTAAIEFIKTLL